MSYEDFCWNLNFKDSKPSKMDLNFTVLNRQTFLRSDDKSELIGKQDNVVCFVCVVLLNYISVTIASFI